MTHTIKSIRAFIGAKNFQESIKFYEELGFKGLKISNDMYYFSIDTFGFYLQKCYVKDWVDNSMLFLEVDNVFIYFDKIKTLELTKKYKRVKLSAIQENDWGKEFFLHDPSGILWHIGQFN